MADFPTSARTVIIGGGVIGCAVAYHLAREGRRDIVVLERSKLTSGTTWHAAGLVRRLRPSATLTQLINYSIDLYRELETETGQATGWVQTGSLSIATHRDRLTHLKRQVSLGRAFGLEAEVVDAKRTAELWPLLRTDDVIASVWSPVDGRVNPSDVALALSKGAKNRGVQFFEDTEVSGFEKTAGRISKVKTPRGDIACEEVVIACGLWSREMAALAGAHMPLYACEHFYMLTKPLPGIDGHLPTLNDQDAHLYARDDVGGLLVGSFEPNAKGLPMERLPKGFSFDLLDENWDHFSPMMENALSRIPALETAEVRTLLNGPESFTLDSQFMLGESPDVPGLFLIGGMNSTGIALAGGAGRALAEWMIAGDATMDLNEADIRRFAPQLNVLGALSARIPEVLGKHYEIAYPGRSMASARGHRRSPLHHQWQAAGAHFIARNAWERAEFFAPEGLPEDWQLSFECPPWRDLVAREHKAALESALLMDQSAFGKILVQGVDAASFLNRVCANQMAVAPGRIVYTQILNARGGIESDITVQRHDQNTFLLIVGANETTRNLMHFKRVCESAQVTFSDVTSAYAVLGLAGPRARDILCAASTAHFPNISRFHFKAIEIGLASAFAGRLSYTGEDGYELYIPADMAGTAYEALLKAGTPLGLQHAGLLASGSLRIEAGMRAWGHEMGPGISPLEAGTERFVAFDKAGGFIGQEALLAEREGGVKRRIVSLLFDSPDAIPLHDEPIYHEGRVVGQISSAAWSYRYQRSVALALINAPLSRLENEAVVDGFEVEIACQRYRARASLSPAKSAFLENNQ